MSYPVEISGVPEEATTNCLRGFFRPLIIPSGNVIIWGGKESLAFVGFGSEQERGLALMQSGHFLMNRAIFMRTVSLADMNKVREMVLQEQRTKKERGGISSDGDRERPTGGAEGSGDGRTSQVIFGI